jgi:hypothetical protein
MRQMLVSPSNRKQKDAVEGIPFDHCFKPRLDHLQEVEGIIINQIAQNGKSWLCTDVLCITCRWIKYLQQMSICVVLKHGVYIKTNII